jgi:hypothetical protein
MIRKIPKIKPILILTFDKPTHGFWDGGAKTGGRFTPELLPGRVVEWGSRWELNRWFTCGFGRSLKHAATIAKKRLEKICAQPCKVEIVWE